MNAMLTPNVAPKAGGTGLMFAAMQIDMITGIIIFAEAVFEVTSVIIIAIYIEANVMPQREFIPLN